MKEIFEDKLLKQLAESWVANEADISNMNIDETATQADKEVYFTDKDIVGQNSAGIHFHILVTGEDGEPAYVDSFVPNAYIRVEGDRKRISSSYVTKMIPNFNKGLYAAGELTKGTDYTAIDHLRPKNKLKEFKILPKDVSIPRYNKRGGATVSSIDIKDRITNNGVKIDPNGELKKALITKEDGSPTIVNIKDIPNYLVGFEISDSEDSTIRINDTGDKVIVAVMPVPMTAIDASGLISTNYANKFVSQWNSGFRYVYNGKVGKMVHMDNPKGHPLSIRDLSDKLVDLDRAKPDYNPEAPLAHQKHRLQQVDKGIISDENIEQFEAKLGREPTRKEFLDFVKGKGLIPPVAFDMKKPEEERNAIIVDWLEKNPIIASYLKSRKKARSNFAGEIGRHETPDEAKARMSNASNSEPVVIDDALFAKAGTRDGIWASDAKDSSMHDEPSSGNLV